MIWPPVNPRSLAATARGADRLLGPALAGIGFLLVAGWTLPIMTIHTLVFLDEHLSIVDGAVVLWQNDEAFLCAVVVLFSIVFPTVKILGALWLWYGVDAGAAHLGHALEWLEVLGRWSMLDVFLVALSVAALQVSLISDVTTHPGLYVFTAAVVLSMMIVRRLITLTRGVSSSV